MNDKPSLPILFRLKIEDSILFRSCPQEVHDYLWAEVEHFSSIGYVKVDTEDWLGRGSITLNLDEASLSHAFGWTNSKGGHAFWLSVHSLLEGQATRWQRAYLADLGFDLTLRYLLYDCSNQI